MTSAASLAAIVGHVGITHHILTAFTDGAGADLVVAQFVADCFFGLEGALAKEVGGVQVLHAVVIHEEVDPFVALIVDDQTVPTGAFERDGEPGAGEAIADVAGLGRFGSQAELAANWNRRTRENPVSNTDGVFSAVGVRARSKVLPKQARGH